MALITNHGYLDNPTFRGMRQHLMQTFDEIYILDLHGNSKKKEICPNSSSDQNIFDIQQGVAISIFVKHPETSKELATVYHADLWGKRESYQDTPQGKELIGGKYHWLAENNVSSTEWETLEPQSPFYLFEPQDTKLLPEYQQGWKVNEIMPVNSAGVKTHRDHFAIDIDRDRLYKRIEEMRKENISDREYAEKYNTMNSKNWKLNEARKAICSDEEWQSKLIYYLYRPFDRRFCYYSPIVMDRPRRELLNHVAGRKNVCLCLGRQGIAVNDPVWSLISVSSEPVDTNVFRRGGSNVFPLYLYPTEQTSLFDTNEPTNAPGNRRPNLAPEFIQDFSTRLGMEFMADGKGDRENNFAPEDIFDYMYAVFHSPTYRSRYAEFLKIDFPRLPLTSNPDLFRRLTQLGSRLVKLHLMEETGVEIATFPESGNNTVEKIRYSEPQRRVWINKTQYFEGVPREVWKFHVGGYQVCEKWLKDRKGRQLQYDDLSHYQNIVSSLSETISIMEQIDEEIEERGGFPIQ